MKNIILAIMFLLLLMGCNHNPTKPDIQYKPIYPPESLTRECYPDKPNKASIGDIITIQDRALDQCNDQLEGIREWRILEEAPTDKEKNNE